jgi:ATP-dependent DNA helicase RecG
MDTTKDKISKLIKKALEKKIETNNIEFKDARAGIPSDLWRPITAFANSPNGGLIVFGVKEENPPSRKLIPVGNLDIQTLQEKIVSLMEHSIQNHSEYNLEIISISGKDLLVLEIHETEKENKPCYKKKLGMDKGACIRVGNVNQPITEEELRSFLRYSPAYNFDKTFYKKLNLDNLDKIKIKLFLDESAKKRGRKYSQNSDIRQTLANIGILTENESKYYPTLAGTLIFSKNIPQDYAQFSRYIVRCVSYAGNSPSSKIIDKKEIIGTLDNQVDESLSFILRSIKTKAKIIKSKRVEEYEYPELALREIVVNALIHRDYSNTGTYVQITIFKDRVEITNPGTLPPGVTVENLKVSQFSRNGIISKVMRDLDYMEEFGRGIDLIYSEMKQWGLVEPLFKNSSNSFKVTLLGSNYLGLNQRQLNFWHILQNKNHLTASIAHENFPEVSRATINSDLKQMVKLGLIKLRGSSSNSYYEPEY